MLQMSRGVSMPDTPTQSAVRAYGRSLADFDDAKAGRHLTAAERALLTACARGTIAALNDHRPETELIANPAPRPTIKDDTTTVRADFIRFLVGGGDEHAPVQNRGVLLAGAVVIGVLDLRGIDTTSILALNSCVIEEKIRLDFAATRSLDFTGSLLSAGMSAEGLKCHGSLWLRNVDVTGELTLTSADIEGYLLAEGAVLTASEDAEWAMSADGIHIGAQFRLYPSRDGATRPAAITGGISLAGATIDGDLVWVGASIVAGPRRMYAMLCQRTTVGGSFTFKGLTAVEGIVDLSAMSVGILDDDLGDGSWAKADGSLVLDGFTYARLAGDAVADASQRRTWLGYQQDGTTKFRPQPWDQLIAVLRASGHPLDATKLAIMKEDEYRRAGKVKGRWRWTAHWLLGALVRYGYEPERLASWLLGTWLAAGVVFLLLGPLLIDGLLVPAKSTIASNCLVDRIVAADRRPCPAEHDAPAFLPLSYSADLLVPGLHLGDADEWKLNWHQSGAGAPLRLLGVGFLFVASWFERIFGGTGFSVLAVVVGGYLLKKRD
jgi:hypothetical protein